MALPCLLPPSKNRINSTMEDCNMLVGDCVVLCCCSQCLILQIIIFVFLNLPRKIIRKTKRYTKKKLNDRRTGRRRRKEATGKIANGLFRDDEVEVEVVTKSCISTSHELVQAGLGDGDQGRLFGFECCIQEVEKVLEELSRKGEFAFGSFWGRSDDSETSAAATATSTCIVGNDRFDFVQYYEFVDMSSFISVATC